MQKKPPRPIDVKYARICNWLRRHGFLAKTFADGTTAIFDKRTRKFVKKL